MNKLHKLISKILGKGTIMSLATVDSGGPWVADLIYISDNRFNLYWISRKNRRHSEAIKKNPRVAANITISDSPDLGLQMEGLAEELPEIPKIAGAYLKRRGNPKSPITDEHAWYRMKPTKIEILDEIQYSHKKPSLKL